MPLSILGQILERLAPTSGPDLWCRVNDSFVILPRGEALVKPFGEYIVPNLTYTHYIHVLLLQDFPGDVNNQILDVVFVERAPAASH